MDRRIRNSAKALIIKDKKVLLIKIRDGEYEYYVLPGGGQETDELLKDTVCREVLEEVGLKVECKDLIFVAEGTRDETFHRVDFVFLCELVEGAESVDFQGDSAQIGIEWVKIDELNKIDLYQTKLRTDIKKYYEKMPYNAYLGNEGD